MDTYLGKQDYKATWALQDTINSEKRPGMRGGHQLIIDSANSVMYLFGGWDGFEDLSDLWCYSIKRNSWTLIHEHAEKHGGPTPRSCHKMVHDPCNGQIFTLGRYLDSNTRTTEYLKVQNEEMKKILPNIFCKKFIFLFFRVTFICTIQKQDYGH